MWKKGKISVENDSSFHCASCSSAREIMQINDRAASHCQHHDTMAGIIKNQILKHLSRFVKNLSSDKISLSTLKGEGELTNLELDEAVLTDLLALPTWMKLTHAHCNKAAIRIPWTKLKSTPILLALDSVTIRVEACEKLRQGAPPAPANSFPTSAGKYGFVNKVIDGITATINTVEISFHSQAFESTVQINRIRLESQSPNWKKAELSHTRLKCMDRGETLIFKAMEWQTLRLEARSTSDRNLAPLRLLTNQARAHIVIKKKLADCQVLGCRLTLLLDDLLWVLTDSQILAALHFMNSLSGLIKESTETTQRFKAARKLESLPEYQAQLSQTATKRDLRSESAKIFDHFDVKETSYHFLCEKIDLHFCDDPGGGRSRHEDLKEGGAFQVSLNQVLVDFYPYHLAKGERRSWKRYTADNALHQWLERSLNSFRIALIEAISSSSMHSPLTRTQQNNPLSPSGDANPVKKAVSDQLGKLMSTCLILKVQDLRLHKVTTSSKANVPQPFLSSYIDRPKDLQTIHMEFTWFYCPGEICFPLPSPKIFAHFYPFQLHLDVCTILWLNCFVTNLQNAMSNQTPVAAEPDYADVRIEILMPKIVFENNKFYASQKDRPQSLHMQVSRLVVSNFRSNETGSLHELTQCLETLQRGDLAYGSDFPSKPSDIPLIPEKFIMHAEGRDKVRTPTKFKGSSFQEIAPYLTKDMLNTEPRDVWYIFADPFWADFRVEGKRKGHSGKGKVQHENSVVSEEPPPSTIHPFIDSLPLQAWVYMTEEEPDSSDKSSEKKLPGKKSIKALFSANGICNVQLNHYQYLFLMRMIEALSELSLYLTYDLEQILGLRAFENLFTVLGVAPNVEVSLVFPPVMPPPAAGGGKFGSPNLDLDATEMLESPSEEMDEKESDRGPVWKMMDVNPKMRDLKPTVLVTDNLHVPRGSFSVSSSPVNSSIPSMESLRAGFAQVKQHGFQSLVSLNKVGGLSTPDSEIASQWSNLSDESDENAVPFETLDEDFVSKGNDVEEAVEVATEVLEDNRSTPSPTAFAFTTSSRANRPENDSLVGVLTLNLENVELAQEVNGLKTEMKFQCRSLALKECTSMAWNEFQTKFATRNREWASETNNSLLNLGSPTQKRVVKVRVSQNIDVNKFKELLGSEETRSKMKSLKTVACPRINLTDRPGAESPLRGVIIDSTDASLCGKIDLRNEPPMTLHMSSVMSLTDFLEDEILPSPFPIKVEVMGVNIELIEDRPAANITSPGPVPIRVSVPQLPVSRDKDGVFYVGTLEGGHVNADSSGKGFHATTTDQKNRKEPQIPDPDLVADFEKLQRQVQVMHTRNAELENELQNTQSLKLMVLELQEQVEKLQREKSDLLTYLNHR